MSSPAQYADFRIFTIIYSLSLHENYLGCQELGILLNFIASTSRIPADSKQTDDSVRLPVVDS